ncbi:hypothetical protein [Pseudonocardia sp.]|uniref:hypothetical protein n=1 Tax=Pseudonocardia sp. TaxID=60912 RepID=UPI00261C7268|nr:hypothetical protein [Pseudonocardia sp.]
MAGAAGTTALNAATQLDVALRGRAPGDAPQQLVARLADPAGRPVSDGRAAGLGPLGGTLTGVAVGGVAGLLRAAGVRLPAAVGGPLLGAAAMLASDGPMTLLGLTDPRRWSATDWAADVVPHLVYGVTTHAALAATIPAAEAREARPPARTLLRAAAIGAASGSRSTAGLAAVALTSTAADRGVVASRLGSRAGTVSTAVAAATEFAMDKSPAAPPRTAPPGLVPRAAFGAATAAGVAGRDGDDGRLAAVVGLLSALGAAVLGVRARAAAERRFGSDLPGAITEDLVAAGLGWFGARRPT